MKIVYIAGKFRGPNSWAVEQNIREAELRGFQVAQSGAMPLIPHTMTRFFDGTLTDEFWLLGTLALLERCDAVLMVSGWEYSVGAKAEREHAKARGLPVFDLFGQFADWLRLNP